MKFEKRLILVLLLLLYIGALADRAGAQTDSKFVPCQAKRQKAEELFDQGRRLEALPLLEELVQSYPKDDQMLVALAASLVEHAATLTDQDAAARERFRARELLDQAWKLGNTGTLAQNLAHLLKGLPAN